MPLINKKYQLSPYSPDFTNTFFGRPELTDAAASNNPNSQFLQDYYNRAALNNDPNLMQVDNDLNQSSNPQDINKERFSQLKTKLYGR